MKNQLDRRNFLKGGLASLPLMAMQMSAPGRAIQQFTSAGASVEKPNILVMVFDTLSAPHTSLEGYGRGTTPNMARFAESATVYHNHFAAGNFTSPGTASLLTGTYPWTHRAMHIHSTVLEELAANNLFSTFDESYYKIAYTHNVLVAALLEQFRTDINQLKQTRDLCLKDFQFSDRLFPNDYNAAFLAEWQTLEGSKTPGSLTLSFVDRMLQYQTRLALEEQYGAEYPRGIPETHRKYFLLEDVIDWLLTDLFSLPQPFLAYIHVLPPHEPYRTRRDFVDVYAGDKLRIEEKPAHFADQGHDQTFLNKQRRHYDEFLAFTDSEFGRLHDHLQQSSLLDNTLMVVTSDHGQLFERGIHGHLTPALYRPVTHVPLLIKRPGQIQRQDIRSATSCVDLLPTLLAETKQAVPLWCEGEILPVDDADRNERTIYSVEAKSNPKFGPLRKATIAMVKGDFELIRHEGYGEEADGYELYNLSQDPEELENLFQVQNEISMAMNEELEIVLSLNDKK